MAKDQVRFLKEELADTIKEFELVEKSVYDSELAHAINTGGAVYDSLIKENAFQIEDLLKKLSSKYGLKSEENPRPMMPEIKKFPLQYCLENALIPIGETDKVVEFGICVPNSLNALKNLSLMIGKKTSAKFIPPFYILQSIQQKHIHTEVDVPKSDLVKDKKEIIARENKPKKVELGMEVMEDKLKKKSEVILDLDALGANEQKDKKLEDNVNLAELSKDIKKDSKPDIKIPESDGPVIELNLPDEEDEPSKPKAQQQPKKSESIKKSVTTKKPVAEISGDVVSVVDEILSEAVMNGTSDVHIEIFKDIAQIRYRNGGTLLIQSQYKVFIAKNYNAVVARIKILANLDIAERRLPQDGKISYTAKDGTEVDFRISILPTSLGERIVIRILNSSSLAVTIGAIGFTKKQEKEFIAAVSSPQGMVLVTGPTGSGKSTTLYGAMNYLNEPDVNILTAEDPVEYTMAGISQVQIREEIGLTFADALRSFLRQDPEIILVGEIRDGETADIASKAALTGHLVLSTLHTNSAVGAISRLINMGLPAYLVSSAVTAVVAQRLIRVNCESCKVEIDKNNEEIKQFMGEYNIKSSAKLMKGKGCDDCNGTGYKGRKGVHEILTITPDIEEAITEKKSEQEIVEIAKKDTFTSLADAAVRFVEDGTLSVEEYLRVIPQDD
ncbi:ATPase, T2SS/T4P/T4SS family [Methylophilaceae bacterium]|nr:ATPase, T2SS/T4P/T4SS family [Methylophilaceae bacterium]